VAQGKRAGVRECLCALCAFWRCHFPSLSLSLSLKTHVYMCGSLSVYLAHSLRATGQQSCKTNNNNKTYNNNNNNKKNKCKFKCRIFILENGNPTDGWPAGCCLTETKTIFLFSLFASEFTN
jgi:hypothetical protein